MIKIAVCDDEPEVLDELLTLLNRYRASRNTELIIESFQSPLDMLNAVEHSYGFDAIILDILMPGINGIETAAEIRRFNKNVKIIFLTSSSEYAVQSYTVNAFYYLLKPIQSESLFPLLDSVSEVCTREQDSGIMLNCKNGITHIKVREIEFCEVIHRTLFIHLISGKILESIGSLDNLEKELADYSCFMRFHRSYLVNLNHIRSVSRKAVVMTCMTEIPIPRGKYNDIKQAFLECAFCEGQGQL